MQDNDARTANAETIRIVIADDHAIVRDGLRALVAAQPGLVVVGEAADGEEAWRRACELKPDVLLLDLSMPGVSGAEAAERIARDCASVRVIALTMHEERGYVARLMNAGAAGYVLKRTAASELVRAVRMVAAGGSYVDPSLAGGLLTDASPHSPAAAAPRERQALTKQEEEVLLLVARGQSNRAIASVLGLTIASVEHVRGGAMVKLGLTSRAALVRHAMEHGWLHVGT